MGEAEAAGSQCVSNGEDGLVFVGGADDLGSGRHSVVSETGVYESTGSG